MTSGSATGTDTFVHGAPVRHLPDHKAQLCASGQRKDAASLETARRDLHDLKSAENMLFIPADLRTRHLSRWVRKSAQTTEGYLLGFFIR